MFHNWQQILKTILEDGPENTRQQGCCLTVAPSSPFHSRCMLHSAPHWGSGISTHLCFPFFKKKNFYVQEAGAEVSFTTVVFRTYRSREWYMSKGKDVSCSYGVWSPGLSYVSTEHSVRIWSSMLSILCPLQNQVVVAAGRSSWGARLSGALHVYSLSSDWRRSLHFPVQPPPLGPSPSPGWTKYSSSGAMVKPDRGGAPGTDMLTARLPGNTVSYVWIPDDRKQQAFCISSELGTITITPSSSAWILVSLLPRKGSCLVTHSLYHCSFKKIL